MKRYVPTRSAAMAVAVALLFAGPAFAQVELPNTPSKATVDVPFQGLETVYAEDFETGDGGFTAEGTAQWEHGVPTNHVGLAPGQGPGMWATNLNGEYENSACGSITSPAIDLTAHTGADGTPASFARLLYRQWMHAESAWDGGAVFASADAGATWTLLVPNGGYDKSLISSRSFECIGVERYVPVFTGPSGTNPPAADKWRNIEFDLTAFLGGEVLLKWAFGADTSATYLGWYVDDMLVQVGAGASATLDLPQAPGTDLQVEFTPATTLYAEDFEFDDGGWVATGDGGWEWGETNAPPLALPGGANAWGTTLDGDYAPLSCGEVTSPAISIPGADPATGNELARMSFQLWRHLRNAYDGAMLEISSDSGATWNRVTPAGGYDRSIGLTGAAASRDCLGIGTTDQVWSGPYSEPKAEEWMPVTVDITPWMGQDVMFRFRFASSDSGDVKRGIYFDDVLVQVGAAAAFDPLDVRPPSFTAPGWTVEGGEWEYGVPTTGPFSSKPVWATNLAGDHGHDACASITSPALDTTQVPGLGRLVLKFEHHFETSETYDMGAVLVSDDGGESWSLVTPYSGYTTTMGSAARACLTDGATGKAYSKDVTGNAYRLDEVNLQSYQGKTIQVRFAFTTDGNGADPGWYVRSAALTRGAGDVPLTPASEEDAGMNALWAKADGALQKALLEGDAPYRVLVTGPQHVALKEDAFASRTEARAFLDQEAAPFFAGVASDLGEGALLAKWAVAPAMLVEADVGTLAVLAQRGDVHGLALDYEGAVQLVEPIPGEGDAPSAQNTEGRRMLQAEDVWGMGHRGEGITVVVIDTGIDPTHEAFKNADGSSRIAGWVDYSGGQSAPYDDHGHGTHVAGTSVGSALYNDPTNGYYQETGVAPAATLMVAKFLSGSGSGSFENGINSLNWAYDQGADITSNSWGSSCSSSSKAVMQTVRTLTDLGMLSVFAAGNNGPGSGTVGGPGCSESALTVGAVDANKNIASFSSRGPCSDPDTGTGSRICPDVVAKGVAVRSAIPRSGAGFADPTGYRVWQGTSMATPHIAGAVALAEQMKRAYTGAGWDTSARAEEEVFKMTSMDLGQTGEDNVFGWGLPQLLSIAAMLEATDEARIVSSFGASRDLLRQGESTSLFFAVQNLGGAAATGDFSVSLESPDGSVAALYDSTVSLGLLDRESYTGSFVVTGGVAPGVYTLHGTFAYTWTNGTSGQTQSALLERAETFEVKRVLVDVTLDGLDARTSPADLQEVTYTATNVGNEDAFGMTIEFTVPDKYVFVPGANFDPSDSRTQYADPAPTTVKEDKNFGRVTLTFDVGDLPVGESFSFTTKLLPTTPATYRVVSVAKYADGGGTPLSQSSAVTQVIALD